MSLISLLADGQFHSGSALGSALGVSRTAVWKALAVLPEYGLELETVKGKGYRLSCPVQLLDQGVILHGIEPSIRNRLSLTLLSVVGSTNSELMRLGEANEFSVLLAEMQTSGRGRRGREWVSPFGKNVYLSMAFGLPGGPEVLAGLSLVVGLSLAKVLSGHTSKSLKLKWPNDVMIDGRKLAGVLVELRGEATTAWSVVLGVGLNYDMTEDSAKGIDQPWASLRNFSSVGRNELIAELIQQLVVDLDQFRHSGFSGFRARWNDLDFFAGEQVGVVGQGIVGRSLGVDALGNLVIDTVSGKQTVNAGEVSVRARGA